MKQNQKKPQNPKQQSKAICSGKGQNLPGLLLAETLPRAMEISCAYLKRQEVISK